MLSAPQSGKARTRRTERVRVEGPAVQAATSFRFAVPLPVIASAAQPRDLWLLFGAQAAEPPPLGRIMLYVTRKARYSFR